jgi:hypothetical protein
MTTIAVVVAALVLVSPSVHRRRRPSAEALAPLAFLEMAGLAVSAGLSFRQAADVAASEIGGVTRSAITGVLRGADIDDPWLQRVFAAADRAAQSGAPLLPELDGLIVELRAADGYARLERIRKLPVKLLFPLALLVLPGFLLLTVGPVIAGSVQRLGL